MNEKKVDNKSLNNNEKYSINEKISLEKKNLNNLNNIQEDFSDIRKAIDRCIEIIKNSSDSKELNRRMDVMSEDNSKSYRDALRKIDDERIKTEERLKALRKEIEKEDKKISEENNKKE